MSLTPDQIERASKLLEEAKFYDMSIHEMWEYTLKLIDEVKARKSQSFSESIPPGYLYMVTVTQHSDKTESDMLGLWEHSVLPFVVSQKSKVLLASLEHAGAYHIHFLLQMPKYAKNLKRDLSKAVSGNIIDVGRKITTSKLFSGACKYICKDGYPDDKTHVKMLVEDVYKSEGEGWVLRI